MSKYILTILGLALLSSAAFALQYPTFYHTTDQINQKLLDLKNDCKYSYKLSTVLEEPLIYQVDLKKTDAHHDTQKNFILFGEHSRELISPETGMHFLETLCEKRYTQGIDASSLLEKHQFRLILNANPEGRKSVETGDFCKRTNEKDVDLNRNWDDHWQEGHPGDTYGGPSAFSEKESTAIKGSLAEYNPTVFLTVHSGTQAMFTPYAYSPETPVEHEDKMLSVLTELNPKYCDCAAGAAGAKIGYYSSGTCLDYAYDKLKVPYTFAFEIYGKNLDIPSQRQSSTFLQMATNSAAHKAKRIQHAKENSCLLQTQTGMTAEECFAYFNPQDSYTMDAYKVNWSNAISELVQKLHEEE